MDFFIDRNVPEKLARMLSHYDRAHPVIYHDDRFDRSTRDIDWLSAIAGWSPVPAVVSGDGRMLRNPAELQVLAALPLTFFLFANAWNDLKWHDRAWKSVKVWQHLIDVAQTSRPSIFKIPVSATRVDFQCYTNELQGRIRHPK